MKEIVIQPPEEFVKNSNISKWMKEHGIKDYRELYEKSKNVEWFWGELAKDLEWFAPWKKVVERKGNYFKWFLGGKINITYNALDRHIKAGRGKKLAYIWEGEPGDVRKITYEELYREVNKFANALKEIGVKKGDRVSIYLPMIPELPMAMLACARIGAIHSVVFSGFSPKALEERIKDAEAKVLITADGYYRKGKVIKLKENVEDVIEETKLQKVIVVKRVGIETTMKPGRDVWWHEFIEGKSEDCKPEVMDSEDILFIIYTSGTTGKPKGIIHVHGGYAVGTYQTLRFVFDVKENDVWWCTADIGWITGHSYIVYAPLMNGITSVMFEGLLTYPKPDRVWEIVEKYKVTIFYTAPTAVRMFMRYGEEWPRKHDISSLRLLGSVGEPINPEAWMWYYKYIGREKCPIMDTWWQTETGSFILTPLPILPLKPGSATLPFPSFEADIFDDDGNSIEGKDGHLVITKPWPSMLRGIYKNPERYEKTYWQRFKGVYLTGDMGRRDEDGYFWIKGREDDVLNVAGHRIGTAEVESALVEDKRVAEAAVVGKPDPIKGESIVAFVILKEGEKASDKLKEDLVNLVAKEIGPIAKPKEIIFVSDLPKTRSGKIMRRILGALVRGEPHGDITTLRNPESVKEIKEILTKKL